MKIAILTISDAGSRGEPSWATAALILRRPVSSVLAREFPEVNAVAGDPNDPADIAKVAIRPGLPIVLELAHDHILDWREPDDPSGHSFGTAPIERPGVQRVVAGEVDVRPQRGLVVNDVEVAESRSPAFLLHRFEWRQVVQRSGKACWRSPGLPGSSRATRSTSFVIRGSPYAMAATEPVIMCSMPVACSGSSSRW